jgi:PD-(D/E)XK endonuclease
MEGLTGNRKGAIAEAEICAAALREGIDIYRPLAEHGRWMSSSIGYVQTTYGPNEVDAIGVYCPQLRQCYLLPIALVAGRNSIYLRVGPPRNNQQLGLKWAAQYELGAIAQLGER